MKSERDLFRSAFYAGESTESVSLEDFTCILEMDKNITYQWALFSREENNRGKKRQSARDISAELFVNKFLDQSLDEHIITDQIKRFGHSLQNEVRRFLEILESTIKYGDDPSFPEDPEKFHKMWEKELKKLHIVENLKDILRGAIGQSGIASLTAFIIQEILRKICNIEANTPDPLIRCRAIPGDDKTLLLQEYDTFDSAHISSLWMRGTKREFPLATNKKPSLLLVTDISLTFDKVSKAVNPDVIVRLYLNNFADRKLINAILIPLFLCKDKRIIELLPESLTKYSMVNSAMSTKTNAGIGDVEEYFKILDPIYHDTFFALLNPFAKDAQHRKNFRVFPEVEILKFVPEDAIQVSYELDNEKLKIQINFEKVPKNKQEPVLEILKCYCYSALTIKNCQQLTNDGLKQILANNKDIEHVTLSNCININDEVSTWITLECHQLKTLTINAFKLQRAHFKFTQFGLPRDNVADANNETQPQNTKSLR